MPHDEAGAQPELLISWDTPGVQGHWAKVAAASIVIHIAFAILAALLGSLPPSPRRAILSPPDKPREVTRLVAPLTQRAPNRRELSREFNLESLPPRPESSPASSPGAPAPPPRPRQKFKVPQPSGSGVPSAPLPDAPVPDPAQLRAQGPLPSLGVPAPIAPPPQIVAQERPKIAFERPGAPSGTSQGSGRIPVPKTSVEEAVRQAARSGGSSGVSVGDEDEGGSPLMPGMRSAPLPGKIGSSVELLSDPQGADFLPYLRMVLAAVRRNWYAIIPESARMGRTGRVLVQFSIDRSGGLSKIVIATPSGARELDLAAVAGVTASNPFPPLPSPYKGTQIRLQFSFRYNGTVR